MLPIVDKPAIQYIVEEILASGIEEILIISGHAKRAMEDHFDSSPELEQHLLESGKTKELGRNPEDFWYQGTLCAPAVYAWPGRCYYLCQRICRWRTFWSHPGGMISCTPEMENRH